MMNWWKVLVQFVEQLVALPCLHAEHLLVTVSPHPDPVFSDCLVIGAGIAGLLAATTMSRAGLSVHVLEKGRGVGGRMATRRAEGAVFDHGAQFFTACDARFLQWVAQWETAGLVKGWYTHGEKGIHYRGEPGMTAIAKALAENLVIERETLVESVRVETDQWTTTTHGGKVFRSTGLLITAPVPQALAMLDRGGVALAEADERALRAIAFERCIAALAILDRPSAITGHAGAMVVEGEPIRWMADNFHKGISTIPSVTIHSTMAFAESHWDVENAIRIPKLLEAAAPHLQAKVVSYQGHRWGYSRPLNRYHEEAYIDPAIRLGIAGDGLVGGRVEGAALSGLTAGETLASVLSTSTDPKS